MTATLMLMNGRICVSVNFPDASDNFSCGVVPTDENIYNDLSGLMFKVIEGLRNANYYPNYGLGSRTENGRYERMIHCKELSKEQLPKEFFHLRLFKKDENGNYPSFEDIDDIDEMLSDEDTYGLDYYFTTDDDFWFDDDEEPEEEDSTH